MAVKEQEDLITVFESLFGRFKLPKFGGMRRAPAIQLETADAILELHALETIEDGSGDRSVSIEQFPKIPGPGGSNIKSPIMIGGLSIHFNGSDGVVSIEGFGPEHNTLPVDERSAAFLIAEYAEGIETPALHASVKSPSTALQFPR